MQPPFNQRLREAVAGKRSQLCLGLDLDPARPSVLHEESLASLKAAAAAIVEATWEQVWGYKLNFAFFERFGAEGYAWLEQLAETIAGRALVIGDAKRGDIGNSSRHYAHAIFNDLNMDAATVNPYMGRDAIEPFISDPAKGVFILCLTSNVGAQDFQVHPTGDPLFRRVAAWAEALNTDHNVGLVVGATHPDDLADVRRAAPSLPLLIPGVGAQGGSLDAAVSTGTGQAPSIVTVSRGILYAGSGSLDDIVAAVNDYNQKINILS